jgi:hypothetical protein
VDDAFSFVVHVMVALVCPGDPEEIDEITGAVLSTVIVMTEDVP